MQKINEEKEAVFEFLKKVPLKASTVRTYESCYRAIETFCRGNDISTFTKEEADAFCNSQMIRCEKGEISLGRVQRMRRAATLLVYQMTDIELVWKQENYRQNSLNSIYEETLSKFRIFLTPSLAPSSVNNIMLTTRSFLAFMECCGKKDIERLTAEDVQKFIISKMPKWKRGMSKLTWAIKKFIVFVNNTENITINAEKYLTTAPIHKRLLPCFTEDEVDEILLALDTSTSLGKRDYAILKIALGTGLRGVDILGLELSDIDWRKNKITIIQSKTGVQNQLPLLPDVGNAIVDYILNARPQIDSPYVFLRHSSPHNGLSRKGSTAAKIFTRYLNRTNISHKAGDGRSLHALRRTVGTRLVKAEVPLPSIAQILGHKRIDSAKRYISLDDDALRVCCLDISDFETTKEGLY
mgnify:CR=1 FL=1